MSSIEKIIRDNQEEFMNMIINFINEKSTQKQKKAPKTICHFKALGKTYDNDIFTRNYEQFLLDTSKILSYQNFKDSLKGFVRETEDEFPESYGGRTSMVRLHNGGVVSCYSATDKKLEHIKVLCETMGVNLTIL